VDKKIILILIYIILIRVKMPELNKKANRLFPGKVVCKDLVRKIKVGAIVLVDVL
jgi:predicted ATP-dependent Lon-type protease